MLSSIATAVTTAVSFTAEPLQQKVLQAIKTSIIYLQENIKQRNFECDQLRNRIANLKSEAQNLQKSLSQLQYQLSFICQKEDDLCVQWKKEDFKSTASLVFSNIYRLFKEESAKEKEDAFKKQQARQRQKDAMAVAKQQAKNAIDQVSSKLIGNNQESHEREKQLFNLQNTLKQLSNLLTEQTYNEKVWTIDLIDIVITSAKGKRTFCCGFNSKSNERVNASSGAYVFNDINLLRLAFSTVDITKFSQSLPSRQQREEAGNRMLDVAVVKFLNEKFSDSSQDNFDQLKQYCLEDGFLQKLLDFTNLSSYSNTTVTPRSIKTLFGVIYFDCQGKFQRAYQAIASLLEMTLPLLHEKYFEIFVRDILPDIPDVLPRYESHPASEPDEVHYDKFKKAILNLPLSSLLNPLPELKKIQPLPDNFYYFDQSKTPYLDAEKYCSHLQMLILEEARANLQAGLEANSAPIKLILTKWSAAKNSKNPSVFTMKGSMPCDFECGTSCVGLLLTEPKQKISLIGLATYQELTARSQNFKVKVVLPQKYQNVNAMPTMWSAYVLGSLITHLRMYNACEQMSGNRLESQILSGEINNDSSSNSASSDADEVEIFEKLNDSQSKAVNRFLALDEGIQLLQGPPGTGKTSTIIALLEVLSHKGCRTLVCAPSNKAVQVLASRFLKQNPGIPIILVGVSSKLDPELDEIFLSNQCNSICVQLEDCVNQIDQLQDDEPLTQQKIFQFMVKIIPVYFSVAIKIAKIAPGYYRHNDWNKVFTLSFHALKSKENLLAIRELLVNISAKINLANTPEGYYQSSDFEMEILNQSQIIFSTLSTSGRKSLQQMNIVDALIIDEASQAVEAEALIPFALKPRKCLLVGDTKQLPATVLSLEAKRRKFDRSLLWRLLEDCQQDYDMLHIQYRMHPAIREWPSLSYYDNQLEETEIFSKQRQLSARLFPLILAPCSFIDVRGAEHFQNQSYENINEARTVVSILNYLKANNVDISHQVGVITFYSAQVLLLRKLTNYNKDLTINTVDGFQGEECDFIIISFVRANPKNRVGFLNDFRRLNVAITRARIGLIMLGNLHTLISSDSDVKLLIKNLLQRKLVWNGNALMRVMQIPQKNVSESVASMSSSSSSSSADSDDTHLFKPVSQPQSSSKTVVASTSATLLSGVNSSATLFNLQARKKQLLQILDELLEKTDSDYKLKKECSGNSPDYIINVQCQKAARVEAQLKCSSSGSFAIEFYHAGKYMPLTNDSKYQSLIASIVMEQVQASTGFVELRKK